MNENDMIKKVRQTLDTSADELDDDTRRKLKQARHYALNQSTWLQKAWYKTWQPLTGFAVTALLLVTIGFWPFQGQEQLPVQALSENEIDMELMASSDSLYLYEELEFYQWLSETADAHAG